MPFHVAQLRERLVTPGTGEDFVSVYLHVVFKIMLRFEDFLASHTCMGLFIIIMGLGVSLELLFSLECYPTFTLIDHVT